MSRPLSRLTWTQWQSFLDSLYERGDRLERRLSGQVYPPEEAVDAYALSAHAEALQSAEVDGDLWGTLADLEQTARSEAEAWQKIKAFYLERGCVVVQVSDRADGEGHEAEPEELEEWVLSAALAERLGLPGSGSQAAEESQTSQTA